MSHHFVSASPPLDSSPPRKLSPEEIILIEQLTEILQPVYPTKPVRDTAHQLILDLSAQYHFFPPFLYHFCSAIFVRVNIINILTWGLPDIGNLDRGVFKKYRLVFVIEKIKGKTHVQHRIKNLYMCLTKAMKNDDRLYMVTWTHFMETVLSGNKVKAPVWCTRKQ